MSALLFILLVVLLAIVGGVGVLVWIGLRRVSSHLQQNPEAAKLLAEHIVAPLLVGKPEMPEVKKVKGTVV